ncbi:MAG: hypothetical protein JXR14_05260 [Paracoccaceae bacterium]
MNKSFAFILIILTAVTSQAASRANAQNAVEAGWEWSATAYVWGSSIETGTILGRDVTVDFSDIVERLDFGLLGAVQGRNGRWSILADLI